MRTRFAGLGLMVVIASIACAGNSAGQGRDWIRLGQREVNDRLDHDVIPVTAARGGFRRIKLVVERHGVDFHRVVVHYGNGADQDVAMRYTIPAGGETRAIDLNGGDRVIRSVEFWYDANTIRGRKALVRLFGLR